MKFIANGFTASLPEGWDDRTMTTLIGPIDESGFATNIVITKHAVSSNTSIEEFARQQLNSLQANINGLQLIDARPTTINRFPACQQLHRFRADNRVLQQAQTFILCNSIVYAITCTATVEEFDSQIKAFRQVVDSFQLFDPKELRG